MPFYQDSQHAHLYTLCTAKAVKEGVNVHNSSKCCDATATPSAHEGFK